MVAIFIGGDIYYAIGFVFGLLAAVTGGFDVLDGWLIAAYVLVALFFVNALIFARATGRLGQMAVEADEGQRPVEEVVAAMAASNPARRLLLGNATIFALLILDMVLKPF
jgi:hypothetical protein